MRVLMTADAVGGVWTYSLTLARALRQREVECALAVMGPPPESLPRDIRVHHAPYRLEWMPDPWPDVDAAGDWLLTLARREQPDVVHLNGYSHAAIDFGVPKILVAHSCVCSWWRAVHRQPAPPEWSEYRRRVRAGLDGADLVIAPTAAMRDALIEEHGPVAQTAVIPNASEPVAPLTDHGRHPFVFAAARFGDESKNLPLLESLRRRIPWPVVLAGSPRLLPHSEVLRFMSQAAIFCHPALYEPFGLAPLEAALSGCALLLSDIPSLRELWSGAAIFFDPRSVESAASALNQLISSDHLRRDLAQAAGVRARRFGSSAQAESYLSACRSVLTCSGRETASSRACLM